MAADGTQNRAKSILALIIEGMRKHLPSTITEEDVSDFVNEYESQLLALIEEDLIPAIDAAKQKKTDGWRPNLPPDLQTAKAREAANLAAMALLAAKNPEQMTDTDRNILARYSGWGGLSIDKIRERVPAGVPVPDARGLIHEFYTPTDLCDALATVVIGRIETLPIGESGMIEALEPSAGIGRFIRSCWVPSEISWRAVEFSELSGRMLRAALPSVNVSIEPFERWVRENGDRRFGLVLSNPPYGRRGAAVVEDPVREYREDRAYRYFLRRVSDLLSAGGLGVFVIPTGFLTGVSDEAKELRRKVLLRSHLAAAFRLPSTIFPQANIVTDVVFLRGRGGELAELDAADLEILDGKYYKQFPAHILGTEVGAETADNDGIEDAPKRGGGRYGYDVQGTFAGFPEFEERPICGSCAITDIAAQSAKRAVARVTAVDRLVEGLDAHLASAVRLGLRFDGFLKERAAGSEAAVNLHGELVAACEAWSARYGNPHRDKLLIKLAGEGNTGAERFLQAFKEGSGKLAEALATKPVFVPKYGGVGTDVLGLADWLFKQRKSLTIETLYQAHRELGGSMRHADLEAHLQRAGWIFDTPDVPGPSWFPPEVFFTGDLWPKYNRAYQEDRKDIARRLLSAIKPVPYEEIEVITPQQRWIPLPILEEWLSTYINSSYGKVRLSEENGLLSVANVAYEDHDDPKVQRDMAISPAVMWVLGWINHDKTLFSPPKPDKDANMDQVRKEWAGRFLDTFKTFLSKNPQHRATIEHVYNRKFRGFVQPHYAGESLNLARWAPEGLKPHGHQLAGAQRVLENRGGLVAFDVGVGKTLTALVVVAAARQQGWAKRPVVVVPNSIVWKWYNDFKRNLPDYRVAVIGSKLKIPDVPLRAGQAQLLVSLESAIATWKKAHPRSRKALEVLPAFSQSEWTDLGPVIERIGGTVQEAILALQSENLIAVKRPKPEATSELDTPAERGAKWTSFQGGEYDCVLLTYTALARTRMNEAEIRRYAEHTSSIQREITLRQRNLKESKRELTERQKAILEEGVGAWIAEQIELPENWEYDQGVAWDDLGIDLLVVDEAQNFKNLYLPEPRDGGVPRFMGNAGEGSGRSWQLDFRAAAVRRRTGGAGIVLLSATPAKNSPLEFYNILQYVDHDLWTRMGIMDPEAFIDRYCKIETRDVLDSALRVTQKPACVGFQNLHELRDVLFRYGEFKTAEDVGIVLPEPTIELVEVDMDEVQETKYDEIVSQIESALDSKNPSEMAKILGLMARMSLIAIHARLDEVNEFAAPVVESSDGKKIRYTAGKAERWEEFVSTTSPRSPKFSALADNILRSAACGHIVFCENLAAHRWIVETLVSSGIPRERIGQINGNETPEPAQRLQAAQWFNGSEQEPPRYDVILCNQMAYEGIDLQTRTCAIHHIDLPWEPATLQQRNGRGVRQGNTLSAIAIYYYMAARSSDGQRFDLIRNKQGWMASLLKSQDRATNNPAAQQQLSPEEILLLISRNPERTRAALAALQEKRKAESLKKLRDEAVRLVRGAEARFRKAERAKDPEGAAVYRHEAEVRLSDLAKISGEAWPFYEWSLQMRTRPLLIDDTGCVFWAGMGIGINQGANTKSVLICSVDPESQTYSYRSFHDVDLNFGQLQTVVPLYPNNAVLRDEPEDHRALALRLEDRLRTLLSAGWPKVRLGKYDPALRAAIWETHRGMIENHFRQAYRDPDGPMVLPTFNGEGGLVLRVEGDLPRGIELLPPTPAGFEHFLRLAPGSGWTWGELNRAANFWWNQPFPRGILNTEGEA